MKILSMFDGMSCGQIAFNSLGIPVERYVAYEIDKYAIQTTMHNFPNTEQKGDVFEADFTEYEGFDFVVGGSPCTYWSIAQSSDKRETVASGIGWELFQQYVRAIKEVKPKWFIYENNKSMSNSIRMSITEAFGFEPVEINSALVSAQNRQRLYWVGMRNEGGQYDRIEVEQPVDRGILLRDILESNCQTWMKKSYTLSSSYYKGEGTDVPRVLGGVSQSGDRVMAAEPVGLREVGRRINEDGHRADDDKLIEAVQRYEVNENPQKTNTLTTVHKDNQICEPVCHVIPQPVTVRKYECDLNKFKELMRESKKQSSTTNKSISQALDKPLTLVEHWFRNDDGFCVPDADTWFKLKEILCITTDEYDDYVTVFETKDNVFDKANRCYDINGKMSTLLTQGSDNICQPIKVGCYPSPDGTLKNSQGYRIYSVDAKATTQLGLSGGAGAKTGLYAVPIEFDENSIPTKAISLADNKPHTVYHVENGQITIKGKQYPIKLADGYYIIRKLTVKECMRLQTVPEWYEFPVSDSQAYKCLGNGWTIEVIKHLIEATQHGIIADKQLSFF